MLAGNEPSPHVWCRKGVARLSASRRPGADAPDGGFSSPPSRRVRQYRYWYWL